MNLLDLLILVSLLSATVGAYRLGFVARVASWLGLAAGLVVAIWAAPAVLAEVGTEDPLPAVLVAAAVFLGLSALGAGIGEVVGVRLRRALPRGGVRAVDRGAGAALGAVGGVVLLWLLLPVLAEVPGLSARQVRTSVIARAIANRTPHPPDTLQTLRRLVAGTDFPQVFADLRPAPDTGPPPGAGAISDAVAAQVARSTVKVSGPACGRLQQGSGFSPREGFVVTNAHVVAGVDEGLEVLRPDGAELPAEVVAFDPRRDLAVLRVPRLGQPALPISAAEVGAVGAVFGHPGGQVELEVSPARITDRVDAVGRDIYNRERTERDVLFLAAELQRGDSGGPLVDQSGAVVGVAFAVSPDQPQTAYAVSSDELRAVLAQPLGQPVGTGECIR